jgi:hypothetical protein
MFKQTILLSAAILLCVGLNAQANWPKNLKAPDGTVIEVYQPESEAFNGNILHLRSAISVLEPGATDPVFGTFWSADTVATDRQDRQLILSSVTVTDIKVPGDSAQARLDYIKGEIEHLLPVSVGAIPLDEVLGSLNQEMDETRLSKNISTQAPVILLSNQPAVLVTIDGPARLQENKKWDMDAVVNSPFTIVKDKDGKFYLWGGGHWYTGPSATGPYTPLPGKPERRLRKIEEEYESNHPEKTTETTDSIIPTVIVTSSPAELLQSNGAPNLLPIDGTSLLYVSNSPDNIFMDTQSQSYYILLSGRWYKSNALAAGNGWTYVPSDQLPPDFGKIPEGSPKDNVLASVAGTEAAREAVMDAQVPQTAKIDRKTATTTVEYDGPPQFQPIPGTALQYAVNTGTTVLYDGHHYFALDNGVWFISDNPAGPWQASTEKPAGINQIPPSSPVYNAKYVDIYDVTPDYIYMGYTPGYLNSFCYGPTVVYGTGFYYAPWVGAYYYPRPWSWGFDMTYNPWYGWGFGFGYGFDWFNAGFGIGIGFGGWAGGWWGPGFYYPAAWGWGWGWGHGYAAHGWYGRNPGYPDHGYVHANNNLYRGRTGIADGGDFRGGTNGYRGGGQPGRPGIEPTRNGSEAARGGDPGARGGTITDRQGNVFQRDNNGQWQTRSGGGVRPSAPQLNRQAQQQQRGAMRANNFQRAQNFSAPHFGGFRGGFGGGGGGRGGGRR